MNIGEDSKERESLKKIGNMDFGEAIQEIKDGGWVQRKGWNGKNMHIYLEEHPTYIFPRGTGVTGLKRNYDPVIVMYTAQGRHQPGWLASQADILAEDWQVVIPGK